MLLVAVTCNGQPEATHTLTLVDEHDFTFSSNRIMVRVLVNGKACNFMIDTGASGIGRIDRKTSNDLRLDSVGVTDNSDGVNSTQVPLIRLNSLQFGTMNLTNVTLLSRNYNSRTRDIYTDGILGQGFFENHVLELDFPALKVRVYSGHLDRDDPGVITYKDDFVVKGTINGREYEFHLDTGSSLAFHFPTKIIDRISHLPTGKTSKASRANTEFTLYETRIADELIIGKARVKKFLADYSDLAPEINVGGAFLRPYKLTIDQKNKLIKID